MARNSWARLLASWAWVGVALIMVGVLLPWLRAEESGGEATKGDKKAKQASKAERTVMAEFTANGQMQLVLEFHFLEIDSPYGKLSIPVEEIESIELATRLPPSVYKQIDELIFSLGSVDFAARERAEKELLGLAEKAYPSLLIATKHADLEVARRAQELAVRVRESVPAEKLEVREFDVVTTIHSSISGRISAEAFQVETAQFGVQTLRLSDVRSLRSQLSEAPSEDPVGVQPDPGSLSSVREEFGKTLAFTVTGRADGIVWGTGVYTTDSTLATAAVHAGALKVGETGVVRVTIMPAPPAFAGSTQNGITSSPYGAYPAAYQVLVPKAKAVKR